APLGAQAQDQTAVQKMIDLNRQALAAFGNKDYEGAKSALMDAVVLGKEAGLANDKMMARTYLHLGVVYVDGLKDRGKGIRYMGLALRIRPDIPMTPALVTPTVTAAFDEAKRDPQAAASGNVKAAPAPAPKAAPAPKPAPAPAPPPPPPVAKPTPPPAPGPGDHLALRGQPRPGRGQGAALLPATRRRAVLAGASRAVAQGLVHRHHPLRRCPGQDGAVLLRGARQGRQ